MVTGQSVRELLVRELSKRTYITQKQISVDDLFDGSMTADWMKSLLSTQQMDLLFQRIDEATPVRLLHTVSTYLLGIAMREGLGLTFSSLPRIFSVSSMGDAFYFFWSGICLCHDLGYSYETIDDLVRHSEMLSPDGRKRLLQVEYDLLSLKREDYPKELTENEAAWVEQTLLLSNRYNQYRLNECHKIDHGIAGAAVFYDTMKRQADKGLGGYTAGEFGANAQHSRFSACCLLISCTIARHNMWVADSPGSIAAYETYGLQSLCRGPSLQLVSTNKPEEQMLFLLDFWDTIDPVKNTYVRAAENTSTDPQELKERCSFLLNNIYISFDNELNFDYRWAEFLPYHQIILRASCSTENEKVYFSEFQDRVKNLSGWLSTKEPEISSDSSDHLKIVCFYPRQRYREPSWPGGITGKEIDSICLYGGSCISGKSGRFYQLPNAYQTFNLLMMDTLQGEKVRICDELQDPDGVYIRDWRRTLEVFTDIFQAQCRYQKYVEQSTGKVFSIRGYRVDRALNVEMMRKQHRTFAFTSISKDHYLLDIAKGKKEVALLEIMADGVFPLLDYADILKENYVHVYEAEILLPPFLSAEADQTDVPSPEAQAIRARLDRDTTVTYYTVHFSGFRCVDNGEDPYALIEYLEQNKEAAAKVLEHIRSTRTIDVLPEAEYLRYIDWKKQFCALVQKCFYSIWKSR